MRMKSFLLLGLLASLLGCSDPANEIQSTKAESTDRNDSRMVDEDPTETFVANEKKTVAEKPKDEAIQSPVEDASNAKAETTDTVDARALLADTLSEAKKSDKKLLVHFGSPG